MKMLFFLICLMITTKIGAIQIYEANDDMLNQLAHFHSLSNGSSQAELINPEKYPITNPNQLSYWTIGHLYKLPIDVQNCSFDRSPTAVIPVTIQTSHLLGPKAEGFECWATEHYESRTVYFFGQKEYNYKMTRIPLNETQCAWIVAQMTDFDGIPLHQERWDFYTTGREPDTSYSWTGTDEDTVTNYNVRRVNITTDINDFSTIEVSSTHFQNPCSFTQMHCRTGERKGAVIWGGGLLFAGKTQCTHRKYSSQSCLLSNSSIRCIDANIVISSIFQPYRCGRRSAFVRVVLTSNSMDPLLVNSSDFVPSTADFHTLYEEVLSKRHPDSQLLATQFAICEDPNY